jgi:hypothetical protein
LARRCQLAGGEELPGAQACIHLIIVLVLGPVRHVREHGDPLRLVAPPLRLNIS